MRRLLILLALLTLPILVHGQTVSPKAQWDMPATVLADAQSMVYTLKNGAGTTIPMGAVTCVAGSPVKCSASIIGTVGPGTYTMTAFNGIASATSAPFAANGPSTPSGFTITITITVTPPAEEN